MSELHGEKIDIVDWSDDPAEFVGNALSPAKALRVEVVDAAARAARVIVPDFQLSLAIGKEGQNARLAARLTGWRIDIRSDTEAAAEPARRRTAAHGAGAGERVESGRRRRSAPPSPGDAVRLARAVDCRDVVRRTLSAARCAPAWVAGSARRASELLRVVAVERRRSGPASARSDAHGCRVGVRTCTPIRRASTSRSGAGPSAGRCGSPGSLDTAALARARRAARPSSTTGRHGTVRPPPDQQGRTSRHEHSMKSLQR